LLDRIKKYLSGEPVKLEPEFWTFKGERFRRKHGLQRKDKPPDRRRKENPDSGVGRRGD